jgi:hypothetical protein
MVFDEGLNDAILFAENVGEFIRGNTPALDVAIGWSIFDHPFRTTRAAFQTKRFCPQYGASGIAHLRY